MNINSELQRYKKALKECRRQRDQYLRQYLEQMYGSELKQSTVVACRKVLETTIRKVLDGNL